MRHLIADTCSKQGLPLPTSSWHDYTVIESNGEERVHNYLVEIANKYCKEVFDHGERGINNTVFNSLFSIKATDSMSNGLVTAGLNIYFKSRGITDKIRKQQMRVISYAFNFFGTCIIETIKSGGVPKINWISLIALSKNLFQLITVSYKETKELDYAIKQLEVTGYELAIQEQQLHINLLYEFKGALTGETEIKKKELIDYFGGNE